MTLAGRAAIKEAQVLIGAQRHLTKWNKKNVEAIEIDKSLSKIADFIKENIDKKIVVLASGEPTMYGIASYLRKYFDVEVISGISSIQYLFSKIEMNMNDLYITSTHGKYADFSKLNEFEKVAMVTDNNINPQKIAQELMKIKSNKKMIVGENLSYKNEKIYAFDDLGKVLEHDDFAMNVVLIYE